MSRSPANEEVDVTAEERASAMRQYQATLKSPDVSNVTEEEARDLLSNELGWDEPRHEVYAPAEHQNPASIEASSRAFNPHSKRDKRAAEL
ncbi:uncharacterized protein N7469_003288 [Penicillium citrinum]|uniref:Uncharacterized protein n=2 Tax=Penicillium TaxID=5073 RepID=A0A9W9P2W8_PENCI|nr:uncharacterized protein N7469_003288 [Penicillium citrinum]KAJ5234120.1 hypothetical protein N7469_003288 [Penicillium citrinum]KAJ5589725.1 hypothetical protein N7450_003697 [Penicillium hetheringtonii]